jgi:hypothetical protein
VVDIAIAAGFLLAMLVERQSSAQSIGPRMPAAVALSVIVAGALAVRRRAPLTAYLCSTVSMLVGARFVVVSDITPNANLIQVYSLGLYATRSRARVGVAIAVAAFAGYFAPVDPSTIGTAVAQGGFRLHAVLPVPR